jgi:hypothetical protein
MIHNRSRFLLITLLLTLCAFLLRIYGVAWSLPYVDHPDEPAIVGVLLRMVQGDLNPKHFFYPTFIMYLHALLFKIHFWWGSISGLYNESFTLPDSVHFFTTIPQAFIWSRTLTAVLGTATVLTLALWGSCFVGRRESLLAAALLAFSSWAVIHDHYITVDGPSALFGLLALLAALQVLHQGTWRDYILAGVLIGLAAGTKYQNVLVATSVGLAHALRWRKEMFAYSPRLLLAALLSAGVFLLTTPYIVLAFGDFWHDISTLFESYGSEELAHGDVTGAWPLRAYLLFYWRECLQPIPFVLAIIGGITLVRRSPSTIAVLLLFPVLMIFSLLRPLTHFYRNLLPTLPPLLLLSGIGGVVVIDWLWQRLPQMKQRRQVQDGNQPASQNVGGVRWIPIALIALMLAPSVVQAYQASARLAQPDSRVVAQEYIHEHLPGIRVASELSHALHWDGVTQSSYVHYLPRYTPQWYREQGFGVLLANEGKRGREELTEDYAPLLTGNNIIATFGKADERMLGPRIDLLDMGLSPENIPITHPRASIGPLELLGANIGHIVKQGSELRMEVGRSIKPGRTLAVVLFWTTKEVVPPADYTIFLHLRDAHGRNLAQIDVAPWHGLFPPESWQAGKLVTERLEMWLPYELPPGEYQLVMGLYSPANQTRFPTFADGVHLTEDEVDLGGVEVVAW